MLQILFTHWETTITPDTRYKISKFYFCVLGSMFLKCFLKIFCVVKYLCMFLIISSEETHFSKRSRDHVKGLPRNKGKILDADSRYWSNEVGAPYFILGPPQDCTLKKKKSSGETLYGKIFW